MHIKELNERAHEKGCDDCSNSGYCDDISRSAAGNQKESHTKQHAHYISNDSHILELAALPGVHDNQGNGIVS